MDKSGRRRLSNYEDDEDMVTQEAEVIGNETFQNSLPVPSQVWARGNFENILGLLEDEAPSLHALIEGILTWVSGSGIGYDVEAIGELIKNRETDLYKHLRKALNNGHAEIIISHIEARLKNFNAEV